VKKSTWNDEFSFGHANPYRSPIGDREKSDTPIRRGTRWRLIPTILFSVLGAIAVAVGLALAFLVIKAMVSIWPDPELRSIIFDDTSRLVHAMATPPLILIWGMSWLMAARASWLQRWRILVLTGLVGAAAATIAFNIPVPT